MSNKYMVLSTYTDQTLARKADVLKQLVTAVPAGEKPSFGIRMYIGEESLGIEWYKGKNELFAENAAENYVQGIKNYERA
jgi:hypothetical protein